jgi:hypothetical protein
VRSQLCEEAFGGLRLVRMQVDVGREERDLAGSDPKMDGGIRVDHPAPATDADPAAPRRYFPTRVTDSMTTGSTGTSRCMPLVPVLTLRIDSTVSMPLTTLPKTA